MTPPPMERFMRRVSVDAATGCWNWTGTVNKGYGTFWFAMPGDEKATTRIAHRAAWVLFRGPIPEGLQVDHLCRNKLCVNPDHLEPVTNLVNQRRAMKPHCKNGHSFTVENVRIWKGRRLCRRCSVDAVQRYRARKGAAA